MLFWLIVMALIGLGFLVAVNLNSNRAPFAGITPSVTKNVSNSTGPLKTSTANVIK